MKILLSSLSKETQAKIKEEVRRFRLAALRSARNNFSEGAATVTPVTISRSVLISALAKEVNRILAEALSKFSQKKGYEDLSLEPVLDMDIAVSHVDSTVFQADLYLLSLVSL